MSFREAEEAFRRSIIKERWMAGSTTKYLGTVTDAFKKGLIRRQKQLSVNDLMKTPNTERACRSCKGGKVVAVQHTNGLIDMRKCLMCSGTGRVVG